jgi:flagellar hook-associated protein FlgK
MAGYSIFSILNTGVLGTYTAKMAMSVTGHNVSNANTDGYSRQRADIVTTIPVSTTSYSGNSLLLGTGSSVARIERLRDEFLDTQYREITRNYAYWDEKTQNLQYMEQVLNEPSDEGLRSYFDGMWNSFLEVLNDSTNAASISSVTAAAESYITTAQDLYSRYEELRSSLNQNIKDSADSVNLKLAEIADLNSQIRTSYILNAEPNDLLDSRDILLDELAELTGMTYKTGSYGHLEIFIGNQSVLYGDTWTPIKAIVRPDTQNMYDLYVRTQKIDITGGTVGALFQMRDVSIPNYLDQLDELSLVLADKMNLIHRTGYDSLGTVTGVDFFEEMEALRSELPNLFRTMGTNSIMNGPIHMITTSTTVDPSRTNLSLSGKLSLIDLNNLNQLYAVDSETFGTGTSFQDIIDYLNQTTLYTTRAYNLGGDYDFTLTPDDFPTYSGKAEVFYRSQEKTYYADSGTFYIGEIQDIDNNGVIDTTDIELKDSNGNVLTDFDYDFVDKTITIKEPFSYTGDVYLQQWHSYVGQYRDGELVVPPNEILNKTLSGTDLLLDDYVGYTSDAKVFYAVQDNTLSAVSGSFDLSDLIDINRDDQFDGSDFRVQVTTDGGTTWIDISESTYDESTGKVTIKDNGYTTYTGSLRVQYWASETQTLTAAGTVDLSALTGAPVRFGDFSGVPATEADFHVYALAELSWEAHSYDAGTGTIALTDKTSFNGDALTYYARNETCVATAAGTFSIDNALIDVNRDGKYDESDIYIQVDTTGSGDWVDIRNFAYDAVTDTLTILDDGYTDFTGDVRLRRWQSQSLTYTNGEANSGFLSIVPIHYTDFSDTATAVVGSDFKVLVPETTENNDFRVYLETMRADTMTTSSGDYKLLFGKVDDGINQYGNVDKDDVNSYGDMREMLVFDQEGILERMGYETYSREFLKISETLLTQSELTWGVDLSNISGAQEYSILIPATGEKYESSGAISLAQLANDFQNDEILSKYFTLKTTTDDEGVVTYSITLKDSLSGPEALSVLKGSNILNFQITDVNPVESASENIEWFYTISDLEATGTDSYEITFDFPVLSSTSSSNHVDPVTLTFTDREDLIAQIEADPVLNQYLSVEEKDGEYRLAPTESLISLQGLEGLQNIEASLKHITAAGETKLPITDLLNARLEVEYEEKSLTLTVPVFNQETGATTNTAFTLTFRNRDELIEKINNNAILNQYIKVFELDGDYYITNTTKMESIETLVTKDESALLSSETLKVLNPDAYDTLANVMYDYSYAAKKDYAFSAYTVNTATSTYQANLNLKNNLLEYEGNVEVKYAVKSSNKTVSAYGAKWQVDYGVIDITDINEDGKINADDIKIFETGTTNEISFTFSDDTGQILLQTDPGVNVDIVYWRGDSYSFNDFSENNTNGYTLDLSEPVVHFADGTSGVVESEDFLLRVELPPDEIELTLGTTPVNADLYSTSLSDLVTLMNEKAPSGILSDLTPDGKLVFRAGDAADFSFGRRLEDGRIIQMYDLTAPTIFWEKLGFLNENSVFGSSWNYDVDIVRNYLDPQAQLHEEDIAENLDIDTRQADGLYGFTKRLSLSNQLSANPQLLAIDFGKWYDLNGDWVSDLHVVSGGSNSSETSIMNLMSEARYSSLLEDGRVTFNDFLGTVIAEMGIEAETAVQMKENSETMKGQITNARESVKGVSLDEEMSNLIKYQHAFTAAARIITAVDEMIQTVVTSLGLVGR